MKGGVIQYKPEYCEMLIKHMAQGKSVATFGATIGVSRNTIYRWFEEYPEFQEARCEANQRCQEWFENRLQAKLLGVKSKNFDPKLIDTTLLIFALKTRFYETYGDNIGAGNSGSVNVFIDGKKVELKSDKSEDPIE